MSERGSDQISDEASLAAEYALGVLDASERAEAQRRVLAEPAFAQEVEGWQSRLAALADEVVSQAPPAHVWSAVQRRLGDKPGVVELQLRRSLTFWRSASAVAAAAAAALAVVLVLPKAQPAPKPVLTARLAASSTGPAVFVALYDPDRHAIVLTPASVSAAPDRSPELWLIPTGGKPIALGVAAFKSSVQLIPAASIMGVQSGVLAVSIEPQGGSTTGQPTGPVIATGHLTRL